MIQLILDAFTRFNNEEKLWVIRASRECTPTPKASIWPLAQIRVLIIGSALCVQFMYGSLL